MFHILGALISFGLLFMFIATGARGMWATEVELDYKRVVDMYNRCMRSLQYDLDIENAKNGTSWDTEFKYLEVYDVLNGHKLRDLDKYLWKARDFEKKEFLSEIENKELYFHMHDYVINKKYSNGAILTLVLAEDDV